MKSRRSQEGKDRVNNESDQAKAKESASKESVEGFKIDVYEF
jgi:hypothetical protein